MYIYIHTHESKQSCFLSHKSISIGHIHTQRNIHTYMHTHTHKSKYHAYFRTNPSVSVIYTQRDIHTYIHTHTHTSQKSRLLSHKSIRIGHIHTAWHTYIHTYIHTHKSKNHAYFRTNPSVSVIYTQRKPSEITIVTGMSSCNRGARLMTIDL